VTDVWHPTVIILTQKMGHVRDYPQIQRLCSESVASAQFQLTFFFPKDREAMFFGIIPIN